MMRRRICFVTTSRADFGLLSGLMRTVRSDAALRLQVIVSGTHLTGEWGDTCREIERAGIRIDCKVRMPIGGRSNLTNLAAIGSSLNRFGNSLAFLRPHFVVLLGDRTELLAPAVAALMLQIPIAHIHGGELSEGAIDDSVRHALTKLASLHFAATEVYRRRIIQMGESPRRVFNFGAPGLDQVHAFRPPERAQLEQEIGFKLDPPVAVITYHPVTRDATGSLDTQVRRLISALQASGIRAVVTAANADAGGARINASLRDLCRKLPESFIWIPHLGHRLYLSCLAHCSMMIGNSSSGLTEAPSFRLPVVNIGDRQRGRVRAANILDVPCQKEAILRGIRRALSPRFRASLRGLKNPYDRYGDGRTNERIRDILREMPLGEELVKKEFHDLL